MKSAKSRVEAVRDLDKERRPTRLNPFTWFVSNIRRLVVPTLTDLPRDVLLAVALLVGYVIAARLWITQFDSVAGCIDKQTSALFLLPEILQALVVAPRACLDSAQSDFTAVTMLSLSSVVVLAALASRFYANHYRQYTISVTGNIDQVNMNLLVAKLDDVLTRRHSLERPLTPASPSIHHLVTIIAGSPFVRSRWLTQVLAALPALISSRGYLLSVTYSRDNESVDIAAKIARLPWGKVEGTFQVHANSMNQALTEVAYFAKHHVLTRHHVRRRMPSWTQWHDRHGVSMRLYDEAKSRELEGDLAGALALYQNVAELEPSNMDVRMRIASVHEHERRFLTALEYYLSILWLHPEIYEARYRLATICSSTTVWNNCQRRGDQLIFCNPSRLTGGLRSGRTREDDLCNHRNPVDIPTMTTACSLDNQIDSVSYFNLLRLLQRVNRPAQPDYDGPIDQIDASVVGGSTQPPEGRVSEMTNSSANADDNDRVAEMQQMGLAQLEWLRKRVSAARFIWRWMGTYTPWRHRLDDRSYLRNWLTDQYQFLEAIRMARKARELRLLVMSSGDHGGEGHRGVLCWHWNEHDKDVNTTRQRGKCADCGAECKSCTTKCEKNRAEFNHHLAWVYRRCRRPRIGWQAHYNAACFYSLAMGQPTYECVIQPDHEAMEEWYDRTANWAERGLREFGRLIRNPNRVLASQWLLVDPDLRALRNHPMAKPWLEFLAVGDAAVEQWMLSAVKSFVDDVTAAADCWVVPCRRLDPRYRDDFLVVARDGRTELVVVNSCVDGNGLAGTIRRSLDAASNRRLVEKLTARRESEVPGLTTDIMGVPSRLWIVAGRFSAADKISLLAGDGTVGLQTVEIEGYWDYWLRFTSSQLRRPGDDSIISVAPGCSTHVKRVHQRLGDEHGLVPRARRD